jgi:AcrR family transcriptional regulator
VTDEVKSVPKPSRRERARQTREKILRAADEEFRTAGYHGATMAAIAHRAGLAVQTVYFVFHTKAELLGHVVDAAVLGWQDPIAPEETDWYRSMQENPDAGQALCAFVRGAADVLARAAPLKAIVRDAATVDPEARRVHELHERMRYQGYRRAIELIADKGPFRADVDLDTATDILLTFAGDDVYQAFRRDRKWSHERCVEYLCTTLPELLLAQP